MGKKKKKETTEFDFEKSYNDILEQAKTNGLENDLVFQTLIKEFRRMKELCDRMTEEIDRQPIADMVEGSKGQYQYKSNPVIKDYISGHKALVSTSAALKELLANVNTSNDNDWL